MAVIKRTNSKHVGRFLSAGDALNFVKFGSFFFNLDFRKIGISLGVL